MMALSRRLYETLKLPNLPGDDLFIYLSSLEAGLSFVYVEGAQVHFKSPTILRDYIGQSESQALCDKIA